MANAARMLIVVIIDLANRPQPGRHECSGDWRDDRFTGDGTRQGRILSYFIAVRYDHVFVLFKLL